MEIYEKGTLALIITLSSFIGAFVSLFVENLLETEKGFKKWGILVFGFLFVCVMLFIIIILINLFNP